MCGGDALADILGRRAHPTGKLPWSKRKSWLGSLGMLIGGWLFAVAVTAAYLVAGHFSGSLGSYLIPITIIAFIGTLIESLPFQDIDNITVTVSAVLIGHLFGL
jgi:phytol kinase